MWKTFMLKFEHLKMYSWNVRLAWALPFRIYKYTNVAGDGDRTWAVNTHVSLQTAEWRKLPAAFRTLQRRRSGRRLWARGLNTGTDVLWRRTAAAFTLPRCSAVQRNAHTGSGILLVDSSMWAETCVAGERARTVATSQLFIDAASRLVWRRVPGWGRHRVVSLDQLVVE